MPRPAIGGVECPPSWRERAGAGAGMIAAEVIALDRLQSRFGIHGYVVFGSVARGEHVPGRDLDVIGLTQSVTRWTYNRVSEGPVCVDLNLGSVQAVKSTLDEDWRWQLNLSDFLCVGECGELPEVLAENRCSLREPESIHRVTRRLVDNADEQWGTFDGAGDEWPGRAAGLRAVIQVADALLWEAGEVPYRYHGHLDAMRELGRCAGSARRYASALQRIALAQQPLVPAALAAVRDHGDAPAEPRLRLLDKRYRWLCSAGAVAEAMMELRKALWGWTISHVCRSAALRLPGDWRRWHPLVAAHRDIVPGPVAAVLGGQGLDPEELRRVWHDMRACAEAL